jgi:hypothetical protein
LDEAGGEMGPAQGEMSKGLFFITPIQDAVSYRWVEEEL